MKQGTEAVRVARIVVRLVRSALRLRAGPAVSADVARRRARQAVRSPCRRPAAGPRRDRWRRPGLGQVNASVWPRPAGAGQGVGACRVAWTPPRQMRRRLDPLAPGLGHLELIRF